ncbi:flagellar assembly protein FliH [soil metagenome]
MSSIVPKGELSAFQRWEMASFDEKRPTQIAEPLMVAKVSDEDVEKARESARLEGYAKGYEEAYALGLQQGKIDGLAESTADMAKQVSSLAQLSNSLSEQMANASENMGQDLLSLAIDLAQAMTKHKLDIDPEIILPIVREAIEKLPSMQQSAQLILHPDDAIIVKDQMGNELEKNGWRIMTDSHIERGGCKLESSQNLLDATVATRWHRLTDALMKNIAAPDRG